MTSDPAGGLPQRFADEMGRLIGPDFPKSVDLAVSGGGDSMAMLYLAAPWARVMGIALRVCTVNHNLRAAAVEEAELVATACAELGLPHETLEWQWDGQGNLQDAARRGRLAVIDAWRGDIAHVAMAHTLDDQAETVLMRLARGSGVDGLAGMRAKRAFGTADRDGWVVRPLLDVTRSELRHYLNVLRIPYVDDPSNDDPRFNRVAIRQSWDALEHLGLTKDRLASTAAQMRRAQSALADQAWKAHLACLWADDPAPMMFDLAYDRDAFAAQPREIQLRLLAGGLQFVGKSAYRPRLSALEEALDRALGGGATTLHGGFVYPHKAALFICAEHAAVARGSGGQEGRWSGNIAAEGLEIRILGEKGAAQLRHLSDLPARVLWPTPALWDGDEVLSAPRLGANPHWSPQAQPERLRNILTAH